MKSSDLPWIRFHEWKKPAFTFGYFIDPEKHIDLEEAEKKGYEWARRPTGGGIIFHSHDISFAIGIPLSHPKISLNTLENYFLINRFILKALPNETTLSNQGTRHHSFCMAAPTIYDLVYEGKKIGGSAQRRTKEGLLHQGSLMIRSLIDVEPLIKEKEIFQAMIKSSSPLQQDPEKLQKEIKKQFYSSSLFI